MVFDPTNVSAITDRKYMHVYTDYTIPSGGGIRTHGLGYVPYFELWAIETGQPYIVPIHTGNIRFPSGDIPFLIVDATTTAITITEDIAPTNATTYYLRVFEDPLP